MGIRATVKWAFLLLISLATFIGGRAVAADTIADPAMNLRWHFSEKSSLATFLGGDKPETAILVLNKAQALGCKITVESDSTYIMVYCTGSPHVAFRLPVNPDGISSKFVMTGGDQPTLLFNDKEQVQQEGKWIQIVSAKDATITLELGTANFAKVKFELPAQVAIAAVPVAAPAAAKIVTSNANELLHTVTPNQLLAVCNAFDQGINKKCSACNGTGEVSVQVQTGTEQQGIYSVPIFRTEDQKCQACNGTGITRSKDDALIRLAGSMVKDMAAVKKDDPKTQGILTDAYSEITKDMIGDQKCWTTLTANGRSILAQSNPKIGTTVVTVVEVKNLTKDDNDKRRFLVRVIGTDKQVYVDDPILADEVKSGHALMGGIVEQPVGGSDGGEKTTALRGGFLITPAIDQAWWWWNKD